MRNSAPPNNGESKQTGGVRAGDVEVGVSRPDEREAIGGIAHRSGVFSTEEEQTVFELFDEHLRSNDSGYEFLSARIGGKLAGFACFGSTPLTQGTFDLYWICADPEWQGCGVGRIIFAALESELRSRGGRMLVIWTSATRDYLPAMKFYERMGCVPEGRIRDYHRPGDDLVVYVKYFSPQ